MRDPDGIYLKLEESPIPKPAGARDQTQIMGMPYIGINVSDVEASVSFYRRFGYESVRWINEQTLSPEESAAWGSISRSGTVALMWPLSAVIITGFAFYNGSSPSIPIPHTRRQSTIRALTG